MQSDNGTRTIVWDQLSPLDRARRLFLAWKLMPDTPATRLPLSTMRVWCEAFFSEAEVKEIFR
jgi:hypothetical protein